MSRLSFQTFCIEFYSHHIQKSSDVVFSLFEKEEVLDLHFIQQILENRQSDGQRGSYAGKTKAA